jgi:formate hydrogenlyase transcriptional activator
MRISFLLLREEIDRSSLFEEIVGASKAMRLVLKHIEKVAPSDSTVLIVGETGTGKELIARALHRRSKRAAKTSAGCSFNSYRVHHLYAKLLSR